MDLPEVEKQVEWLTDRVWRGPDNLHKRVGTMETFKENMTIFELPALNKASTKIREDFEEFKKRIFGNGEIGYVEREIEKRVTSLETSFESMVDNAVEKAFAKREMVKRDKWDARSWALVLIVAGFVINSLPNFIRWLISITP
jgi:hypothetical protein